METNNTHNQKGFTLVEIAIVLVIIGLLLGGVLKGQELITSSKIKSTAQDFEGISAAYYAYQDRTGKAAGDTGSDGQIDDNQRFWDNLRSEGFISGASGAAAPTHALDGVFSANGPTALFGTKNFICATNIPNKIANGIDTKLDDGDATTGSIRSGAAGTDTVPPTASAYTPGSEAATVVCKEL